MIPSVAYTDPEVAWMGVTKNEAKGRRRQVPQRGLPMGRVLPVANARPGRRHHQGPIRRIDRSGSSGCGIVGPNAGDLIAEAALAIETGSDAGLTIYPHPTLSDNNRHAAEASEGTITDLYLPNKEEEEEEEG